MLLRDLNNILLDRFQSINKEVASDKQRGIDALNMALAAVWRAAHWSFRKRIGQLTLVPPYTTGTCSYTKYDGTNESSANKVTFSGASLTQKMVGWYWQPDGSANWYKIIRIDGNDAYLEASVVETSASGKAFKLWKRINYLKSEVDHVLYGLNWDLGDSVQHRSDARLAYESGNGIGETGETQYMNDLGNDPYDDVTYTTGTVSADSDSLVLTGVSTSWFGNVNSGDIIKISPNEYNIKRVESDTRIILYQRTKESIPSGSTYEVRKDNPIGLQFYRPADAYKLIEYVYLTKPFKMLNENYDHFPMDTAYEIAVLDRAEAILLSDIDKQKWREKMELYNLELNGLKAKKDVVRPRSMQFHPTIPTFMPGRGD